MLLFDLGGSTSPDNDRLTVIADHQPARDLAVILHGRLPKPVRPSGRRLLGLKITRRRAFEARIEELTPRRTTAPRSRGGQQVGTVTSPASSPRLGTMALAVLDAEASADGERVEVAVGDGTAAAEILGTP
ncbi:MAG: glycine cleavage T C-terminal barrel domain-containing protein [Actinomycetota bacterium]